MKQEGLKERVELLEIGEKLGYPRLGYGRSTKIPHDKRIPQGKDGWEKFAAHAHIRRVLPALRIGRVLRDNNVMPYHPLSGAETKHGNSHITDPVTPIAKMNDEQFGDLMHAAQGGLLDDAPELPSVTHDEPAVPVKSAKRYVGTLRPKGQRVSPRRG